VSGARGHSTPDAALRAPDAALEAAALIAAARSLEVTLSDRQAGALLHLLDLLSQWNRAYNLTAITERSAMIRDHLLDSLSAAPELRGTRIADVGTGAGFPGLPLALIAAERRFTLIDSVAKKIRFVQHAAGELALSNVTPLQARVEQLSPEAPFDTIVTRAFAPLPVTLERIERLAAPGTRLIALKGRYPHAELAQLPARWSLQRVRRVSLPGSDAQRHLVLLQACP
jgi:16S rRNA (guanine527-N7)-methyltransferase